MNLCNNIHFVYLNSTGFFDHLILNHDNKYGQELIELNLTLKNIIY